MENILKYYLMPHPPLIIPSIGKGKEFEIQKTVDACNKIAKEIQELKPETIIVVTPHGTKFSDTVCVSNEEKIKGDFRRFKDSRTTIETHIDREFNYKLNDICSYDNISVVMSDTNLLKRYNRSYALDYGTMVPLYFINQVYKNYKLVHITYNNLSDIQLYKLGMAIKQTAKNLDRKTVFIASGNLSKRLKEESEHRYLKEAVDFDTEMIYSLQNGDVESIFNMDKYNLSKIIGCGLKSIFIMLGVMDSEMINGELLSYESAFNSAYSVMEFNNVQKTESRLDSLISKRQENINKLNKKTTSSNPYVKLARESLNHYYTTNHLMAVSENIPSELRKNQGGVFVSLKKSGELRGCVGTVLPQTDSIAQEIIRNTVEAATNDAKFPRLTLDELAEIDICVDVLDRPHKATKKTLNPKKYGILITQGHKRGIVLPNINGVNTPLSQIKLACEKANINMKEKYEIEKFEVTRYIED